MTTTENRPFARLASVFNGLSLRRKILLGFSLPLLLFVTTAGIDWTNYREVSSGFERYSKISVNATRVQQIDRDIVGVRRNAALYMQSGRETERARLEELRAALSRNIDAAVESTSSAERRVALQKAQEIFPRYMTALDRAIALRGEREKMIGDSFAKATAEIRAEMVRVGDAAMAAGDPAGALAMARVEVTFNDGLAKVWRDLGGFEDTDTGAAIDQSTMRAREAAGKLKDPALRAAASTLAERLGRYADGIRATDQIQSEITRLTNVDMAGMADEIAAVAKGVVASQKEALTLTRGVTQGTIERASDLSVGVAAVALIIGFTLAMIIGNGIIRPISGMTRAMRRLSDGDSTVAVPALDRKDEIGVMAHAVQVFKENMIEADRLRADADRLSRSIEKERRAILNSLADNFETSVSAVVRTVSSTSVELRSTATSMSRTAATTSQQAGTVASASEQASNNVQTVASATEELASSVAEITRQVTEAKRITGTAVDEAGRADGIIAGLSDAAEKIGAIVQLISGIASQTNLLALNATIEAARAGEAGKGFAVVAAEVKNLASQTAQATGDIIGQVAAIQGATGDAVKVIREIGGTIATINDISTSIASAVEEQAAATREIARNIQQAASGTTEVSANIGGVTRAAGETGAASHQVLASANALFKNAETLTTEVDQFILKVRAG